MPDRPYRPSGHVGAARRPSRRSAAGPSIPGGGARTAAVLAAPIAMLIAVQVAAPIAGAPARAQESQLGEIFFDLPCHALIGDTPAEARRFARTAVMAFAGYIAARVPQPVAREMLADFDTLAQAFDARCGTAGGTLRQTMDDVVERYLDGS